jgi:uncharacterized membrane protein (UPF0127 family)
MSMRRNISTALILTSLCCLSTLLLITACERQDSSPSTQLRMEKITLIKQDQTSIPLHVEIAKKPADLAHGLMGRESMPPDHGMLFIFPHSRILQFWMKNTPLFLDMIFMDEHGKIVHIHSRARPFDETLISSQVPALAVLEINGGLAKEWGLEIGDRLTPLLW